MVRRSVNRTRNKKINYKNLLHPFSPQNILSEDCINQIHENALNLLEEVGISVLLPEAVVLLKKRVQPSIMMVWYLFLKNLYLMPLKRHRRDTHLKRQTQKMT